MKLNHTGIVLIFIIIAALAVSGCTHGILNPRPSATVTAMPGAISPTATGAPAGSPAVDFGQMHAYDYRFNTSTGDVPIKGDLKTTYSLVPYGEINARLTSTNMTSSTAAGPSSTAVDVYVDPTSGSVLGGFVRVEVGGQLLANRSIAAGEQVDKSLTSTPVLTAAQNSSFAKNARSLGTDQVMVPLGTFGCTKYLVESRDSNMTYWIAPGVPLPLKMVTTDRVTGKDTMTMELVSYS